MNFSDLFRQSSQICEFSPDGKYLASIVEFRVVIRDVDTFQVKRWFWQYVFFVEQNIIRTSKKTYC